MGVLMDEQNRWAKKINKQGGMTMTTVKFVFLLYRVFRNDRLISLGWWRHERNEKAKDGSPQILNNIYHLGFLGADKSFRE